MNNMKKLLALLLAMAMVFCMAACAGDDNGTNVKTSTTGASLETKPQESEPNQTEPTLPKDEEAGNPDDSQPSEFVYAGRVVDMEGNPIEGVWVQICAGSTCVPKQTNASGVAVYTEKITGDGELTAKLVSYPSEYTPLDDVVELMLGDVGEEVQFVLQGPSADEYVYTAWVEDIDGNPVEGAWVQICAGTTCVPKQTDADGIAYYDSEITGDGELTAKLISLPEAYSFIDLSEGREISMADGSVNVCFVLESIPGDDTDYSDYAYVVQVITVEDFAVEGAWVQICAGTTCVPKQTDAYGIAGYEEEITGDGELVAKLIKIPEGYELCDEDVEIVDGVAQIVFLEDDTDVVFVLREIV